MAQGVPGRLRPQIISTFGTTSVVVRQPYPPAAFTPEEIPGTHFQRLSRPQGTWFCRKEPWKKIPSDTTVRLVAQFLNHYASPDPNTYLMHGFVKWTPRRWVKCFINAASYSSNVLQAHSWSRLVTWQLRSRHSSYTCMYEWKTVMAEEH